MKRFFLPQAFCLRTSLLRSQEKSFSYFLDRNRNIIWFQASNQWGFIQKRSWQTTKVVFLEDLFFEPHKAFWTCHSGNIHGHMLGAAWFVGSLNHLKSTVTTKKRLLMRLLRLMYVCRNHAGRTCWWLLFSRTLLFNLSYFQWGCAAAVSCQICRGSFASASGRS